MAAKAAIFIGLLCFSLAAPPKTIPAIEGGSAELNRIVSNSPRLDLFLNLPQKCDNAYDNLIKRLELCKTGDDNGHPSLQFGCFLHIDFASEEFKCEEGEDFQRRSSAIVYPAVTETPWHPSPECEDDCEGTPIWSGDKDDFPPNYRPGDQVIEHLLGYLKNQGNST